MNEESPKPEVILIVDDNPGNLEVLFNLLDEAGFEVWVAQNGQSAIRKVEYDLPDLILLDVMMPVMDGFETCKWMKANPLTQDIPIIFMTALSEASEKVKGLSLGAVDYITKPFQQIEVLARVQLQLKLRSLSKILEQKNQLLQQRTQELEDKNDRLQLTLRQLQQAQVGLRRYQLLSEYAYDIMLFVNPDGQIIQANRAAIKAYGYEHEELLKLNIAALIASTTPARVQEQIAQAFDHNLLFEATHCRKDGTTFTVEVSWQGETIGNERIILSVIRDISERKRAGEALRESEERFRSLCACSPVGIFLTDIEGQCIYTNPNWQSLSGFTFEESLGHGWLQAVYSADRQKVFEDWSRYAREGGEYSNEFRLQHPAGIIHWVHSRSSPLILDNGQLIGYVGTVEDITKRKQAEEKIRKSLEKERELNELKSRFVSLVSHEFRTPLSNVVLSAELLENYSHKLNEEKRKVHFRRIRKATQRMTQLLDNVLLTGKAEAGKLEFKPEPLELEKFCQDLLEELQLSIGAEHSLLFIYRDKCPIVYMDMNLLHHIFINLLSNAIKYSPIGSTVNFELAIESEDVIFRVKNVGIGIPKTEQQRLFEPFHRATNVAAIPGTGLGLTIVKQCVDLHGGQISVESEQGAETIFTVKLPLILSSLAYSLSAPQRRKGAGEV